MRALDFDEKNSSFNIPISIFLSKRQELLGTVRPDV